MVGQRTVNWINNEKREYRGVVFINPGPFELAAKLDAIDRQLDGPKERPFSIPAERMPNETALTNWVIDKCDELGWRVSHFRPARTADGWVTPLQGDKGWPDIVALRGERQVVAELKHATQVDPDQELWLEAFRQIPGTEVYVWRTGDEEAILEVLT